MPTTYTQYLIAVMPSNPGQAANVRYTVYDIAGVVKLTALGTLTEETDDAGVGNTGTYKGTATFDATWAFPLLVKYTISGVAGAVAEERIGADFAALRALSINASGQMQLDPTQAIPLTNTANSTGDCLNGARGAGFGAKRLLGNLFTIYGPDGVTPIHTFTVDSPTAPTQLV